MDVEFSKTTSPGVGEAFILPKKFVTFEVIYFNYVRRRREIKTILKKFVTLEVRVFN